MSLSALDGGDNDNDAIVTEPNTFGLWRQYPHRPSIDPDSVVSVIPAATAISGDSAQSNCASLSHALQQFDPLPSLLPQLRPTVLRLLEWFQGSTTKSTADLDMLVNHVIMAEDFDREDLKDFSASRVLHSLSNSSSNRLVDSGGWITTTVHLPVPTKGVKLLESDAPQFPVHGLRYRKITDVIKTVFTDAPVGTIHLTPFQLFQRTVDGTDQRIYSELYTSDRFLRVHNKIRSDFKNRTKLETVVAAMMLWSDSTHLANFGTAALWPVYLFFGNVSKYVRAQPSSFSSNHIAYLPNVSKS